MPKTKIEVIGEISEYFGSMGWMKYQLEYASTQDGVEVEISSPGGSVTEGLGMYDLLQSFPGPVDTYGYGLVASIASVLLLAGDRVRMAPNAFLMIHNPWAMAIGDADEMERNAELLEKMQNKLTDLYVAAMRKRGKEGYLEAKVKKWMQAETWFTAQEALEAGFIDEIKEGEKVANIVAMQPALSKYVNVPAALFSPTQKNIFHNQNTDDMTVLDQIKTLLGAQANANAGTESTSAQDTAQAASDAPDVSDMIAQLEAAGYEVLTSEEVANLRGLEQMQAEANEAIISLAEQVVDLKRETESFQVQVKAELKKTAGAPSAKTAKPAENAKAEEPTSQFDGLAGFFKSKLLNR